MADKSRMCHDVPPDMEDEIRLAWSMEQCLDGWNGT